MSSIFIQKLNKIMEKTRIIVRTVLFSSPSSQLTSSIRQQPCDPWPDSLLPSSPKAVPAKPENMKAWTTDGLPFILNHSTNIQYLLHFGHCMKGNTYMREGKSWVLSSQCFQRSPGAELSRQQYHRVGQPAGKAEEGTARITW